MLLLAGVTSDPADARARVERAVSDRSGLKKLGEIVRGQGGNPEAVANRSLLPSAGSRTDVAAPEGGFVGAIDAERVGIAALALGAGRERVDSVIDPAVGFVLNRKVGDAVKVGDS